MEKGIILAPRLQYPPHGGNVKVAKAEGLVHVLSAVGNQEASVSAALLPSLPSRLPAMELGYSYSVGLPISIKVIKVTGAL